MNILFLNPPSLEGYIYSKEIGRCGRKSVANDILPQTGLAYLAAIVEKEGHKARIIDSMAERLNIHQTIQEIKKYNPEIIIMNTSTPTFINDEKICKLIKRELDAVVAYVGTHVSVLPKESLKGSEADLVFVNECEYTLKELLKKINLSWAGIKGLCYKKNGVIMCNEYRPLIENLDELPFPARHLLPKYTTPLSAGLPFATIIPSRGCSYQCIFCRAGNVWGEKVRMRSTESVFSEIKKIVDDFGIMNIGFMADTFTINKKWTIDLCNKMIDAGLNINWVCNSRVDTVDEEMLHIMKKAGCSVISYGVESGDQNILNRSKKGITLDQSRKAILLTKKAGILSFAYFIIGLPGETWKSANRAINFAIELDSDYAIFHIATPFPGTEFYEIAKENGWLVTSDWEKFEEEGSAVISTNNLSADDLVKLQKKAMNKFYLRPTYIIKQLTKIRSVYDIRTKIKAGLSILKSNI